MSFPSKSDQSHEDDNVSTNTQQANILPITREANVHLSKGTKLMSITQTQTEQAMARVEEIERVLRKHVATTPIKGWRFNYFNVVPAPTAIQYRFPIIVFLRFSHVSATGYFETEAFGEGGSEDILNWLKELGVRDGSAEIRINADEEEAELTAA